MPDASEFLETADRIGARLCRDALWSRDRCTWTGAAMIVDRGEWCVAERTCGPDLYSGTAGIAVVLARLARLTGEKTYERTAFAAFRQALANRENVRQRHRAGLYSGWSGLSLACRAIGPQGSPRAGEELLDAVRPDGDLDIMSGSAGAILALLPRRLGEAIVHGDRLVQEAVPQPRGAAWKTHSRTPSELTGLVHGASGIGWALLELWHATGEDRFRSVARDALEFEREYFVPEEDNWIDRRSPERTCGSAWCHGAPGIGLVRLRVAELDPSPQVEEELAAAERSTARTLGRLDNFSLCHGVAGNAELWIEGAVRRGEASWLERAREVGLRGIELYEQAGRPWPCGIRGAGETPGLMLGLAGIAWFYLRLHDPVAHPSLLLPVPPEPAAS